MVPQWPFVPLAVALRSMLAETEVRLATAAPAEKAQLRERCAVGSLGPGTACRPLNRTTSMRQSLS